MSADWEEHRTSGMKESALFGIEMTERPHNSIMPGLIVSQGGVRLSVTAMTIVSYIPRSIRAVDPGRIAIVNGVIAENCSDVKYVLEN